MACGCLKEAKAMFREKFDDPEGTLNATLSIGMQTGKCKSIWTPLEYKYHPVKVDGTLSKRFEIAQLGPTFCPLCGVKY